MFPAVKCKMEVDSVISDLNHVSKEILQTHGPVFGSLWPLSNAFLAHLRAFCF